MKLRNGLIRFTKAEALMMKALKIVNNAPCGLIVMGSAYDCDNPINAGVDNRLILMNKEVWDRATITYDVTVTTLITNIVLTQTGDVGFVFQGIRTSTRPQSAFVPASVSVGYDHQIEFQIFDISQEQKDNIEKMGVSKMVAIVQNSNSIGNDNSVFEIFGKDVGLEMQAGAMRINADVETNGSYALNLKTSDDQGKEPKLPTSLWDTDFATTIVKVDALLVPVI